MTALTATPSPTTPGSWDLTVTGAPTLGALDYAPRAWNGPAADAFFEPLPGTVVVSDTEAVTLGDSATLPAAPRYLLARITPTGPYTDEGNPAESFVDLADTQSVITRLPYTKVTTPLWLTLYASDYSNPGISWGIRALYPYRSSVSAVGEFGLYAAGDVVPVPNGDAMSAALPVIERSDRHGTTRVPIPTEDAHTALTSGTLTVTDHAAPLTGDITWSLYTDPDATPVTTTVTVTATGAAPLLSIADAPEVLALESVVGYGSQVTDALATVHRVIGRDRPVLITHGDASSRAGTLTLWCDSYATARAAEVLLSREGPHQLRQPTLDGLDMHFHASSASTAPDSRNPARWTVTVNYTEV